MAADGGNMVENVAPEVFGEALKRGGAVDTVTREMLAPKEAKERNVPEGHVVRTLTVRDRNMIVGACRAYVKGEKGKYKGQFKVDRVAKLMAFEATIEYLNMINDNQAENLFKWQEARQAYVSYRMMKGGMLKVEDFVKQFPDLDLDECPEKPPVKQPELSKEDQRGPESEFHIPSKLDTFIQDALSEMEWDSGGSEAVVELMTKYGLKPEE